MVPEDATVVVYATAPDVATATKLARGLIDERSAACVNILPKMVSVYRWEGEVTTDSEVVMIVKTRSSLADDVVEAVRARHPYDIPAVLVLPVASGNIDFLNWIESETASPA